MKYGIKGQCVQRIRRKHEKSKNINPTKKDDIKK